jgi:hypothetical protein
VNLSRIDSNPGPDVAKRSLYLDTFDLPAEYVEGETNQNFSSSIRKRLPRIIASVNQQLATRIFGLFIEDKSLRFDPRVAKLPGNVTLDGYWQSERYFDGFTQVLRREITVCDPVSGKNQRWYNLINSTDSVSVHVRRGDYVSLEWALPPTYYRNALDYISCSSGATNLFFFSDDMDWVRANREELVPDHSDYDVHYVECNDGETAHEDLRLMRACDHHVVANSSFSWWGAWLDGSETKHVVAPNYWVHDSVDNLDIVPDRWHTSSW